MIWGCDGGRNVPKAYLALAVLGSCGQPGVHVQHSSGQAIGEPGILQDLGEGDALLGVWLQHALEQQHQVRVQAAGDVVVALANPLQTITKTFRAGAT